jgi:hypothetical protein
VAPVRAVPTSGGIAAIETAPVKTQAGSLPIELAANIQEGAKPSR